MNESQAPHPDIEVSLNFHAQLREIVGDDALTLKIPEGSTVADAFEDAIRVHPGPTDFRHVVAFARNDGLVNATTSLDGGDRLDILPPVSGG
ncbi:MAG: MoaD/ThiS family protein [Phycisphaerales bacterium]